MLCWKFQLKQYDGGCAGSKTANVSVLYIEAILTVMASCSTHTKQVNDSICKRFIKLNLLKPSCLVFRLF